LSSREKLELLRLLEAQEKARNANDASLCRSSFFKFLCYFWDTIIQETPVYNWHIKYLCDELQAVVERVVRREPKECDVIINIPPGTTKSTIAVQMLQAWAWTIDPSLRFITGSYSEALALEHADYTRDLLRSDKFQALFPEVQILPSKDLKSNYRVRGGGQRFSTSVGGTVTGVHAHIICIDDPLNPKMAASKTELKNANDWMEKTLSTRKVDKAVTPIILIMQRLAEDDCTGAILAKTDKAVRHICLPADDNWPIKPPELEAKYRENGGLLDPIRLTPEILRDAKVDMGTFGYSGQFGQQPVPTSGGIFLREWWKYYRVAPAKHSTRIQAWDTAYESKDGADWSVGSTWDECDSGYYLRDVYRNRVEYPDLKRAVIQQYEKWKPDAVLVEYMSSGKSIVQDLKRDRRLKVPVIAKKVGARDKEQRARAISPLVESGCVFLPVAAPWLNDFIEEISLFPTGKHDDQVDTVSHALEYLKLKKGRVISGGKTVRG
jgi:predicted phage terminase large subunit-like protein